MIPNRRRPDDWGFNSLSNLSDEVGACTTTSFMSPLRMNWVRKCDHETGPSICGISNDISVSRRTSVNWVTLGKTLIGGSEGELERAVGEVAPADGRQRAE